MKSDSSVKQMSAFVLTILLVLLAMPSWSAETRKVANGIEIYLGVLPAQMLGTHQVEHPGKETKGSHHVLIAVFEAKTGKRIGDATVKARVAEPGLAGEEKKLESMVIADTITYGNYFRMPGKGSYQISVEIVRPGAGPVKVRFDYSHP